MPMKIKYKRFAVLASITILSFGVWQRWFSAPSERQIKRAIEKRLGFSDKADEILEKLLAPDIDGYPQDVGSLFMDLKDLDDLRNLSAGILLCASTNKDSSVEAITANLPLATKATFQKNRNVGITSLIRVEDLSQFTIKKLSREGYEEGSTWIVGTKAPWGRYEGSFNWLIPGVMKGRCNFVYKRGEIDYLGIARNNSLGVYDCQHIFKGEWDSYDLANWMVRSYYAVMRFNGEDIPDELVNRVTRAFFRERGLQDTRWGLLSRENQAFWLMSETSDDLESSVKKLVSNLDVEGREVASNVSKGVSTTTSGEYLELAVKKLVSNLNVEVVGVATNMTKNVNTSTSREYLEQLSIKYRITQEASESAPKIGTRIKFWGN